jgi:hypothetical protein
MSSLSFLEGRFCGRASTSRDRIRRYNSGKGPSAFRTHRAVSNKLTPRSSAFRIVRIDSTSCAVSYDPSFPCIRDR